MSSGRLQAVLAGRMEAECLKWKTAGSAGRARGIPGGEVEAGKLPLVQNPTGLPGGSFAFWLMAVSCVEKPIGAITMHVLVLCLFFAFTHTPQSSVNRWPAPSSPASQLKNWS